MFRDAKVIRQDMESCATEAQGLLDALNSEEESERNEAREKHERAMEAFDKLETELDATEKHYEDVRLRQERVDKMLERSRSPVNQPGLPDVDPDEIDEEKRSLDDTGQGVVERAFRDFVVHGPSMRAESREVLRNDIRTRLPDHTQRDLATGTDSQGGYLIPTDLANEIEKKVILEGPMMDPGLIRWYPTASGNSVDFVTLDDTTRTVSQISEAAAPSANEDPACGNITLNAYKYATTIVNISYELLTDSAFSLEDLLQELFVERMARGMNKIFTDADGSTKPQGVLNGATTAFTTANVATGTNSSGLLPDDFHNVYFGLNQSYRNRPQTVWMFADLVLQQLRQMTVRATDKRPLWQVEGLARGNPPTILGKEYRINPAMEYGNGKVFAVLGDFKKFLVRQAGPYRLRRSEEFKFDKDQVSFVALGRFDSHVMQAVALQMGKVKS